MVAGAFPIAKLSYQLLKQISRPIANQIKQNAKSSPFFKQYVCMPPAQIYHWVEMNLRLRRMGLGKAKHVHKLSEEMAVELGSEMLGEFVVFAFAAGTLFLEYLRAAASEARKEEMAKQEMLSMEQRLQELDVMTKEQGAKMQKLQHTLCDLEAENRILTKGLLSRRSDPDDDNNHAILT